MIHLNKPLLLLTLFFVSSCSQQHVDQVVRSDEKRKAFVEAQIEFPGPGQEWAGPLSYTIYVNARDPKVATVHIFQEGQGGKTISLDGQTVRNRMSELAYVIYKEEGSQRQPAQKDEHVNRGCVSPVKVKLVQGSGNTVEEHACRSIQGWSKTASKMAAFFLSHLKEKR